MARLIYIFISVLVTQYSLAQPNHQPSIQQAVDQSVSNLQNNAQSSVNEVTTNIISNKEITNRLFEGKVYLKSTDNDAEQQALQQAFKQVLIKVSGDSRVPDLIDQNDIIDLSRRWTTELGRVDLPGLTRRDYGSGSETGLIAFYNRESIVNYLKEKHLPIWPYERSKIVLWVIIENWDGNIRFINPNTDLWSLELLNYAAEKRGVSLIIPQVKEEGSTQTIELLPSEAWNFDELALALVSEQYDADFHGIIRLSLATDQSAIGTAFYLNSELPLIYSAKGQNQLELFDQLLNPFIDNISKQNAFISNAGKQKQAQLLFTNIKQYNDYRSIINQIEALEMVSQVTLERIVSLPDAKTELYIDVYYDSDENVLIDNIIKIDNVEFVDSITSVIEDIETIDDLYFNMNNLKYLFNVN